MDIKVDIRPCPVCPKVPLYSIWRQVGFEWPQILVSSEVAQFVSVINGLALVGQSGIDYGLCGPCPVQVFDFTLQCTLFNLLDIENINSRQKIISTLIDSIEALISFIKLLSFFTVRY